MIDPIAFHIGPIAIHWYGIMYLVSFIICALLAKKILALRNLPPDLLYDLLLVAVLGVIVGGRLGYVLFYNLPFYLEHPLKIFAVWEGGLSFHGGLLGIILGLFWLARRLKSELPEKSNLFYSFSDIVVTVAPVGIFFGRIGNFINGELYGRIAKNFCIYFPTDPQTCRYPSQLVEAFFEGLVLFSIFWLIQKKDLKPGFRSWLFLLLYGIVRFVIEFFREPDPQIGYFFNVLTEGQIFSTFMILAGIVGLFIVQRRTVPQEILK